MTLTSQHRAWRDQLPAKPPKVARAVEAADLPSRPTDLAVRRILEWRGWRGEVDGEILRFPTADVPLVRHGKTVVRAFAFGYRLGALLFDVDGNASGIQLHRITLGAPRLRTLGHGAFGTRARTASARRVVVTEGLEDFLFAAAAHDAPGSPVIGVPTAEGALELLEPCAFRRGAEVVIALRPDAAEAARQIAQLVRARGAIPLCGMSALEARHG